MLTIAASRRLRLFVFAESMTALFNVALLTPTDTPVGRHVGIFYTFNVLTVRVCGVFHPSVNSSLCCNSLSLDKPYRKAKKKKTLREY